MASNSKIPSKAMEKRVLKTGKVAQEDIDEYIAQVGPETLKSMGINPSNIEEYIKNIVELGRKEKKKLPKKSKIEPNDSIVVANQKDELAKVSLKEESKNSSGSGSNTAEQQSFRSFGIKLLGAGSFAFNKMFPALGTLITALEKKLAKRNEDLKTVNASNQENARQVSRSSIFLSRISEAQLTTNELLEKIVAAVTTNNNLNAQLVQGTTPDTNPKAGGGREPGSNATDKRSSVPNTGQPRATKTSASAVIPTATAGFEGSSGYSIPTNNTMSGSNITFAVKQNITPNNVGTSFSNIAMPSISLADKKPSQIDQPLTAQLNDLIGGIPATSRAKVETPSSQELPKSELFVNRALNVKPMGVAPRDYKSKSSQQFNTTIAPPMVSTSATAAAVSAVATMSESNAPAAVAIPAVTSTSGSTPAAAIRTAPVAATTGGAPAAVAGTSNQIQNIVQKITQEFPNVNVTSALRPGDANSQHGHGNAVDLSLRGLPQEQRATLVQNLTAGKYGNVGGLGTYNATGDLLHVDTRSGSKMAWGPNRSKTSLNQTPQWFQAAVNPWMSGSTMTAGGEQDPRPGGGQMATPAASKPSSGAQVAQASIRSEVTTMQSQQVLSPTNESPQPPAIPIGSTGQAATSIDPNEPGPVEPADAAQRYAKLFNMAA
jgi:hypothetical protein